jgi:hypothetical protein
MPLHWRGISQDGLEPGFLRDVSELLDQSPFDWYVTEAVRPITRSNLLYDEYINGCIVRTPQGALALRGCGSDLEFSALHTSDYQRVRDAKGRVVCGPKAAPGGKSAHNFGLAIDVALDGAPLPGLQMTWNTNSAGWRWLKANTVPHPRLKNGWSFGDWPHVERYRWARYTHWTK